MDALQTLEQAAAQAATPAARVRALNALSAELARTGQARRAFELTQQARELADTLGDRQLDAETRHALARAHFYLAGFDAALQFLLQAARLYQDCGDLTGAATAFAGIGLCQHRLGAHDDAAASLLRALASARELKLTTLEINLHNSLGSALLSADRMDEAARHLDAGIAMARTADDRSLLNKLLLNQCLLAKRRGDAATEPGAAQQDYAQGLGQALQALELARARANTYDEAHCLGQSGTMLRLLHRHDEAGAALLTTLELGRSLSDSHLQAEALSELGRLRDAEGRHDEACALLEQAIALARRISARAVLAEACKALSACREKQGDGVQALALYKEFHAVREAELAGSRRQASDAAQLWLDFQDALRRASQYRERAETLAADHAVLTSQAQALSEASQRDPMTGLLNRRGLDECFTRLLAGDAPDTPLCLALIDVDHFKQINDQHSHAVGDAVLRRVAGLMREQCRQVDLAVRYGGDEFLLVLAATDLAAGQGVLERLKRNCDAHPWQADAPALRVSLSIGLALYRHGAPLEATIAAADAALYEAKRAGRNRVAVAS